MLQGRQALGQHTKISEQPRTCLFSTSLCQWLCAGIPEEALLDEMSALLPHSALRLLSIMECQGLLSVRSTEEQPAEVPAILRQPSQFSAPKATVTLPPIPLASCGVHVKSITKRSKHHLGFQSRMSVSTNFSNTVIHPAANIH